MTRKNQDSDVRSDRQRTHDDPEEVLKEFFGKIRGLLDDRRKGKGNRERIETAERMLWSLELWLSGIPNVTGVMSVALCNAVALGASVARIDLPMLEAILKHHEKRLANSTGRPPLIDPSHIPWLRERAAALKRAMPNKTQVTRDESLCAEYKYKYGKKVSPRTMRLRLRGKNSVVAKEDEANRGRK